MLLLISRLLLGFIFTINFCLSLRGRIFSGVGVVLRLRTNTVRTEHRAFPNLQNIRVITKRPSLDYNTKILVGLPSLWERQHCTHCTIRTYVHVRYCTYNCLSLDWTLDRMAVFLDVTNHLANRYI